MEFLEGPAVGCRKKILKSNLAFVTAPDLDLGKQQDGEGIEAKQEDGEGIDAEATQVEPQETQTDGDSREEAWQSAEDVF